MGEKLVKDGKPLTEWKCSCGYVQKLEVKSLLEIEERIDFLKMQYEKTEREDVKKSCYEQIDILKWAINWYNNNH